jgi:hypothetical protein
MKPNSPPVWTAVAQPAGDADAVDLLLGPGGRRAPGTMLARDFIAERLERIQE